MNQPLTLIPTTAAIAMALSRPPQPSNPAAVAPAKKCEKLMPPSHGPLDVAKTSNSASGNITAKS